MLSHEPVAYDCSLFLFISIEGPPSINFSLPNSGYFPFLICFCPSDTNKLNTVYTVFEVSKLFSNITKNDEIFPEE